MTGIPFLTIFALCFAAPAFATDTMYVLSHSNEVQLNYPLQFGRPFVCGEIRHYPQLMVDGTAIMTQADVKNRCADGSVKFAIVSVFLPTLPSGRIVKLTFQDQTSGNNKAPTQSELLGPAFDFDATIQLRAKGGLQTASARTMLKNGAYTFWTAGPVATTLLLADDSIRRRYDLGFDSRRPFRPRFYVTFWPRTRQVSVRYVGENSNTTTLENLPYNLKLTVGSSNPKTVFQQIDVKHSFLTRWTKTYWLGGAPDTMVDIDYNLAYVEQTLYFPNYDPSLTIPESTLSSRWSRWQRMPHSNIGDRGEWTTGMPSTGGRFDIGPTTGWNAIWLYTGDWRARTIALGQADLAGAWPLQVREGNASKRVNKAQTISGLGLPISVYAYPSLWLPDNRENYGLSLHHEEPSNSKLWHPDQAHTPDAFFPEYILTGDYYYLEEMELWTAAYALRATAPGNCNYCRGPGAGIWNQVRGDAWSFRDRVNCWLAEPDGSVWKSVMRDMLDDELANWEGQRSIAGTRYQGTPEWRFGYNANGKPGLADGRWRGMGVPPLHFWENNISKTDLRDIDYTVTKAEISPWMQQFLLIELGRGAELGVASDALFKWLSPVVINPLTDSSFNPWLAASYRMPVATVTNRYFGSWGDEMRGYTMDARQTQGWRNCKGPNCFNFVLRSAAALTAALPLGQAAWKRVDSMISPAEKRSLGSNPSFAIIPR